MKVQIKQLVGREWQNVPIEKIVGQSLCDYLLETTLRCVVAVYQKGESKPVAFFVNRTKDLDTYREKGNKATFHAQDVVDFLGSPIKASLVAQVFEGGEFFEIGKIEKQLKLDGT